MNCASYLRNVLDPKQARKVVSTMINRIRVSGLEFDAVVCRGVSGLAVAPIIALRLRKKLIVVRKHEATHSRYTSVENGDRTSSYIIIDDTIDTGQTIDVMLHICKKELCRGIFLYDSWRVDPFEGIKVDSFYF